MLFNNALTYAVALAGALPTVVALYPWNEQTQLYNVGEVPSSGPKNQMAARWMGRCDGGDIPLGGYGCGNYGTAGNAIYKCVWDKKTNEAWLKFDQVCLWKNFGGGNGGQCVKNSRRKGKKFYPLVDGKKAVCIRHEDL